MNDQDYHDHPALSATEIGTFLDDPVLWWHVYKAKDWPRTEPTAAMATGSLIHAVIEHQGWENVPGIVVRPAGLDLRTKAGKEWQEANDCKTILDAPTCIMLNRIWRNFEANDFLMGHLNNGVIEQPVFWDDDLLGPCRCKPDLLSDGILFDWKSTSAKTERQWLAEIIYRHYDVKTALYRLGTKAERIIIVGIQKTGSCGLFITELDEAWTDEGLAKLYKTVDEMKRFDPERYLNRGPVLASMPRWGAVDLEGVLE